MANPPTVTYRLTFKRIGTPETWEVVVPTVNRFYLTEAMRGHFTYRGLLESNYDPRVRTGEIYSGGVLMITFQVEEIHHKKRKKRKPPTE